MSCHGDIRRIFYVLCLRYDSPYNTPVKTIAMINQKGGVGKTTTVVNLGAALANRGRDVCLVDMDPQSHLTLHFGLEPGSSQTSIYDVLTSSEPIGPTAKMVAPHLWVAPSEIDLAAAEMELAGTVGREQILRDRLGEVSLPYEFVMIDCPPSLGLLTLNALAAADEVYIPLQPHFLALQGLGKLLETVSLVRRRVNPDLKVGGVILCMYESTTRLAGEVLEDLKNFFSGAGQTDSPWSQACIFETLIRRNVKLAECPSYGRTIFDYEPRCHGAEDYTSLAEEFLTLMDRHQEQTRPADQETSAENYHADESASEPESQDEQFDPTSRPWGYESY